MPVYWFSPARNPVMPAHSLFSIAPMLTALLLAACATSTVPPPPDEGTRKEGGGYYLDDGPGANPPADLAAIPDAVPRLEPLHKYANRPYSALGMSFTPMTELEPYKARGLASWYGKRYHGSKTATGELYDMYGMTAAHATLPVPSYARVTNVANGRSVVVRINDRGPFHKNRLIDLSYAAAWKLGFVELGSAFVEVESIIPEGYSRHAAVEAIPSEAVEVVSATPADPPVVAPQPSVMTEAKPDSVAMTEPSAVVAAEVANWVQFGAYTTASSADEALRKIKGAHAEIMDRVVVFEGGGWFRVQAGPYDRGTANRLAKDLGAALGNKPFVVKR